jgi:hypothetical protein
MFKRGWEGAKATIVDLRYPKSGGGLAVTIPDEWLADVIPDNGDPRFRAKIPPAETLPRVVSNNFLPPNKGATVRVMFDPKSRKVRFDMSDPSLRSDLVENEQRARYDAAAAAGPTTTPPAGSEGSSSASDEDVSSLKEIMRRRHEPQP